MPARTRLLENLRGPGYKAVFRAQKQTGIQVSLKREAIANSPPCLRHGDAPVHAEYIGAGTCHRFQDCGATVQIQDPRNAVRDRFEDLSSVREREFLVIAATEFSSPGIKELNNLRPGFDLEEKVRADGRRELVEQVVQDARLAEGHMLDLGKAFGPPAFNHVRSEGPWRACKSDQRYGVLKFLPQPFENRSHERHFRGWIGDAQPVNVRLCSNRIADFRAFVCERNLNTHRLDGNQDVGKEDHGIDTKNPIWLK